MATPGIAWFASLMESDPSRTAMILDRLFYLVYVTGIDKQDAIKQVTQELNDGSLTASA